MWGDTFGFYQLWERVLWAFHGLQQELLLTFGDELDSPHRHMVLDVSTA